MSSRVTLHTRRKPGAVCSHCKQPIHPGEQYRQLIAVQEYDVFETGYYRAIAHDHCVRHNEWWGLHDTGAGEVVVDELTAAEERTRDLWNELHPIGTPVRYWPGVRSGPGREGVTTSHAWMISGHASVKVDTYLGGIALSHVEPIGVTVATEATT